MAELTVYVVLWDHCGCGDDLLLGSGISGWGGDGPPAIYHTREAAEQRLKAADFGPMEDGHILEVKVL